MRTTPIVGIIALLLAHLPLAHALAVQVLDPDGKAVPDAVLSVQADTGQATPGEAVMAQQGKRFVPWVLAVRTGTRVRFTNHDPINHHVYSFSAPKQFSLKLLRNQDDAPAVLFDQPGIVVLGCNIHDWMLGYVIVLDSAVFATSDASGRAQLEIAGDPVPALQVWHPRLENAPLELRPVLENGVAIVRLPRLGTDPRPAAVY